MPRPCDHDGSDINYPGCRVCELYFTHPDFRKLWGGSPLTASLPVLPCIHLGEDTGVSKSCESCGGKKDLPVFQCAKYGTCSPEGVLKYKENNSWIDVKSCTVCKMETKLKRGGGGYEPNTFLSSSSNRDE